MITIKFKKLSPLAIIPRYAHPNDAGMDIFSGEMVTIRARERYLISTKISMELPSGYVALIMDRSGLAKETGLTHMAGVIDSTYRGEIKVLLLNTSDVDFHISHGSRIAQLIILPIPMVRIEEADELSDTVRGTNGFGSTGI